MEPEETIMLQSKVNRLIPIGLLMLAGCLMLHVLMRGHYSESAAGFLIGIAMVFIVFGFVGLRGGAT
jgi:hypothetical protein